MISDHGEVADAVFVNYRALMAKVDAFCSRVAREYPGALRCHRGCDACCRHLTLFAVEGMTLRNALRRLPPERRAAISDRASAAVKDGPCPLLEEGVCLLYEARPIICRTHGLPLLYLDAGGAQVDCCPLNFAGLQELPKAAVLNMEVVNTALAAVNALFVKELPGGPHPPEVRLPIRDYLLWDRERPGKEKA